MKGKEWVRSSAMATMLMLLLLLGTTLTMFSLTVVAAAADEEEDPLHIYYDKDNDGVYEPGDRISEEDKAANLGDVCKEDLPLTITILVRWELPPAGAELNVQYVDVEMDELTSFGVNFNPTTFRLTNPSVLERFVDVTIPSLPLGPNHVVIKAKNVGQNPRTPKVAGTEGHFMVTVISCVPQVPQADLSIVKIGPAFAHAGDMIIYIYTVTNAGPDEACNVVVSDDVAGLATYVSGDNDDDGCIDPGEIWTFEAMYTVQAGDPDPLVNMATVSSDADDPDLSNNVATWSVDLIAMICGYKFYDANANGVWDAGEPPVAGFKIELYDQSGNLLDTAFTAAADGSYCFDGLDAGTYTVQEVLPPDSGWMPTTPTSIAVTLLSGEISMDNNFGNLCLEPGHGGKTIGYWANAGNSLIDLSDVGVLNGLNLFRPSGWSYPPFDASNINTARSQIRNYLLSANAKNMWWMLSAQLIATMLNVMHGYLDGSTLVCVNPPTCSTFMTINDIINGAIGALGDNVPRATQEYWKNLLDKLNNNQLPFVSPVPCPVEYP
jgi:uncharacterized repeat protein (TIGR01451 family)